MTTSKRTWISCVLVGGLILLLGGLALPNFLPTRFVAHELLTIRLHVTDQKTGRPVAHAQVRLLGVHEDAANPTRAPEAVTDELGVGEFKKGFEATGAGRSGQFHISDQIVLAVHAHGFKRWTNSLAAVFGPSHDYQRGSKVLTHTVLLEKQPAPRGN